MINQSNFFLKELEDSNKLFLNFLSKSINKKGFFNIHEHYGKATIAASFSLMKMHLKKIPILLEAYKKDEKTHIDTHWEFNNMALQLISKSHYENIEELYLPLNHNITVLRKVTNWQLMRALTYLRTNSFLGRVKGNLITNFVLIAQQKKGILYDNRFYRQKELSFQYHAYATSLLGEIYLETKNKFYLKKFKEAMGYLKKITSSYKVFEKRGLRGSGQIFGYGSAIYALVLGHLLLKDKVCYENAKKLFERLKTFQRKDGSFPLFLSKKEYLHKKYSEEKKLEGWESYNRYFDYLGFLGLYFSKTINLISNNI